MTTVNLDGHHGELADRNLTGFHILAAIARAAHIEREGITSVRTSVFDDFITTGDQGQYSPLTEQIGIGGILRRHPSHTTGRTGPYPAGRWIMRTAVPR